MIEDAIGIMDEPIHLEECGRVGVGGGAEAEAGEGGKGELMEFVDGFHRVMAVAGSWL